MEMKQPRSIDDLSAANPHLEAVTLVPGSEVYLLQIRVA
jgi:hypothetical protein